MKINEITDKNIEWIILTNAKIDFQKDFKLIVKVKSVFKEHKHKQKLLDLVDTNIAILGNDLNNFINSQMADESDPDIIKLKQDASNMLQSLEQIKQEIIAFCK